MGKFIYVAYNNSGVRQEGELSVNDIEAAKYKLRDLGLIPVTINETGKPVSRVFDVVSLRRRPGFSDIELLTSQLSLLLKNGIKIDRALETVKKGIKNKILEKAVNKIYAEVRRGMPLSSAMEGFPDFFPPMYTGIVRVGEATGKLPYVFENLALNLNFQQKIRSKMRQAIIYPTVIFFVCLLTIIFLFNFIIPKFSSIFVSMKDLPLYTDFLLMFSSFFRRYQFIMLGGIIVILAIGTRAKRAQQVHAIVDMLSIRLPLIKQLSYAVENLRFVSSLAILLKSGVMLTEALDYAVKSINNSFLRRTLLVLKGDVRQGKQLSESIAKTGFLPDIFKGIIEAGEKTGSLPDVFSELEGRLKTIYEERVNILITILEPAMIIFMGLVVGSVVVVMLLSMVSVSDISF
ncbi:MAG: type II secretion system F family protein [Deltaproteobacteria bacterium]|nr:type II secretion system F family protein [Deltaproteobacteria bacterium]